MSYSFIKKLNTNFEHVSATAYHYDKGTDKKSSLTLEHISTHDFRSFCNMLESNNSRQFKLPQVVQKFVYSKSSKNQVLKCYWQENEQMICERAFNIHSMYETKTELNDRIHTFESLKKG